MPGKVTVFNSYNETISQLLISPNNAGSIPGWATSGSTPLYTPSSIAVKRTKYPTTDGTASFAYGNNSLIFPWSSRTGSTTTNIPLDSSLDDDLILYLTQNKAILLTSRGVVINTTDIQTSLSAEAATG